VFVCDDLQELYMSNRVNYYNHGALQESNSFVSKSEAWSAMMFSSFLSLFFFIDRSSASRVSRNDLRGTKGRYLWDEGSRCSPNAGQSAFVINDLYGGEEARKFLPRSRLSSYKNSKGVSPPPVDGSAASMHFRSRLKHFRRSKLRNARV